MTVPGGGASCLVVGRPGSGALPSPTAHPLGGLPGSTTHWLWVRGGAGVGTCHQPHSARSFELALRAVGAAQGRPGGGRLLPGCGASGVGRSPTPDCPPSGCKRFECLQLRARAQKSRIILAAQSALTQCRKSAFIFEIPICV